MGRESCKKTVEVNLMVELEFTRVMRAQGTTARGKCGQRCVSQLCSWASEKQCVAGAPEPLERGGVAVWRKKLERFRGPPHKECKLLATVWVNIKLAVQTGTILRGKRRF